MPPEGEDYLANARAKARSAARALDAPAVADDSGLEVAALGGAPGVRSARYATTDRERIARLLAELENARRAGNPDRRARFRCVAALAAPGGFEATAEATWEGEIAETPRGANGFGYDPVFLVLDEDLTEKCTVAELSAEEKCARSHRGKALRDLFTKAAVARIVGGC